MFRISGIEHLAFGDDDECYPRSQEFNRFCIERIRMIPWIILSLPWNCWSFLKYLTSSIADIFRRQYIAVIVLVLSTSIFLACFLVLRDEERIVTVIYCLSFIACSVLSLFYERGKIMFEYKSRSGLLENQQLLTDFNHQNGQEADQPTRYGTKDKRQTFQRASENLMEPRRESEADLAIDFHRCNACNCRGESSAGPSHAPDCFTITNISDDSYDFNEPPRSHFEARISADAIEYFGPPLQVFGADSYRVVLHSSDEDCPHDEPADGEVKTFEAPVKVHHSDSHRPLNSRYGGFSSVEPASVVNAESAALVGSDSHSNLPHADDDQSSEPTCSNFQNDVEGEETA